MIRHSIKSPNKIIQFVKSLTQVKKKYKAGGPEHRQEILNSLLRRNQFEVGDEVWITDYNEVGRIVAVYKKESDCKWNDFTPDFLEVYVENWNTSVPLSHKDVDWIQ